MKNRYVMLLAASLAIVALGGCAAYPSNQSDSMGGMSMSGAELKSMCDKHMKMMGSMSAADQKSMMEEHIKSMSPEMREKHMKEMAMCK
jgi:hypothetical protein